MQNNVSCHILTITGNELIGTLLDSLWRTNNKEIRVDVQNEVSEPVRFWAMSYFIVEDAVRELRL